MRPFVLPKCVLGALCFLVFFVHGASAADNPTVPASVPAIVGGNPCERMATPNLNDASGAAVDFARIPDAPSHIMSAKIIDVHDGVPTYCLLTGYVSTTIGFELRLPLEGWNGKFSMVGCGGMCGNIQEPGCDVALIKGYACIMTDMATAARRSMRNGPTTTCRARSTSATARRT